MVEVEPPKKKTNFSFLSFCGKAYFLPFSLFSSVSFLSFFSLSLFLFALVLDGEHQLVGLVDQVVGRGEHGVGPGLRGKKKRKSRP